MYRYYQSIQNLYKFLRRSNYVLQFDLENQYCSSQNETFLMQFCAYRSFCECSDYNRQVISWRFSQILRNASSVLLWDSTVGANWLLVQKNNIKSASSCLNRWIENKKSESEECSQNKIQTEFYLKKIEITKLKQSKINKSAMSSIIILQHCSLHFKP